MHDDVQVSPKIQALIAVLFHHFLNLASGQIGQFVLLNERRLCTNQPFQLYTIWGGFLYFAAIYRDVIQPLPFTALPVEVPLETRRISGLVHRFGSDDL